jgi:hypothetical protein
MGNLGDGQSRRRVWVLEFGLYQVGTYTSHFTMQFIRTLIQFLFSNIPYTHKTYESASASNNLSDGVTQ